MPIPSRYTHTNLTARDWRRLVHFYGEVFGCVPRLPERDLSGPWLDRLTGLAEAHLRGMHLTLPGWGEAGPTLEIFQYETLVDRSLPAVNQPGFGHLAFHVEDVEEALRAVVAAGGGVVGGVSRTEVPGVGCLWVVYARDPEGNILELQRWEKTGEGAATVP